MTAHEPIVDELLASFEDERDFEALPIDQIEAHLRILGVDSAASIALVQGLAAQPWPPVVRLLAKIEKSEATERQIAEPQSAAIAMARAQVRSEDGAAPARVRSERVPRDLRRPPVVQAGRGWRAKLIPGLVSLGRPRAGPGVRRQMAIAACLPLLVLVGASIYVSHLPPSYEAEALVMLNDRPPQTLPDIPEVLAGSPPNEEGLAGQLLLIKSRSMAERMVDQLNLHMLPEFNPALQPRSADISEWLEPARLIPTWLLDRLPRAWADTLMTTKSGVEMTDQQQAALLRSEIIQAVMDSIAAEPANRSTVIGLKFVSTDPSLAALGANTLASLYLSEQLETKQSASRRAREFLEHEIERLRASVASAEQAVQDYRRTAGLGGALPDEQQLSGLTTQLVISRSDRAQSEARLRQVERLLASNVDLSQAAQLLESPVLTELRARELELNRQRAELSNEFGERHPRMVNLRAELETLMQRKQGEIQQIAQRLRDEVQVGRSREATLEANIESLKSQLAEHNEAQIGLEALLRDADADRGLLVTYLNRAKEIGSQQKAQEPDARIISRAALPDEPTYPRRELIFGVALVGALLWLAGLAWFWILPQPSRLGGARSERPEERRRTHPI